MARALRVTSPAVRRLLHACRQLLSEKGEASGIARARETLAFYQALRADERMLFFRALRERFSPDPKRVLAAATAYATERSARNLKALTVASEPPRQELLRRLNRAPGGTRGIVAMREALLQAMPDDGELGMVDDDFHHLLSSWFNPGFLHVLRVDWNTPAALLEKLIRHEAVHEIRGWDDLRRRLQNDRRCFAFFHPALPNEPLIFVEVALLQTMPAAIAPLLQVHVESPSTPDYRCAVFYGISNCEPGLRGVSLGNFLIKQVATQLAAEFPGLKRFCTLSPVPGFRRWIEAMCRAGRPAGLPATAVEAYERMREALRTGDDPASLAGSGGLRTGDLERLCASYLSGVGEPDGVTRDPVARFHLNNGARLERINRAADLSEKGIGSALGLMVNYVYDLKRVERNHESFMRGRVEMSAQASRLLA